MGFLDIGKPMTWEESLKQQKFIRDHGIAQFLNIFRAVKEVKTPDLLWGDEIEYHVVRFDAEAKTVKISLTAPKALEDLDKAEESRGGDSAPLPVLWHPEYGRWMIEATPGRPYGGNASDLFDVERNMHARVQRMRDVLDEHDHPIATVAFPLMGVGDFTVPADEAGGEFAASAYVPDSVISPHPRFGALTQNIRHRRGTNVRIMVPTFKDTATDYEEMPDPLTTTGVTSCTATTGMEGIAAAEFKCDGEDDVCTGRLDSSGELSFGNEVSPNWIHMDAMAFGMGSCCLQVTFQARDLAESRRLYDHLAVMSPIMLALTAASPIWRGKLADIDTRWGVISASVDDRTPAERGVLPAELPWNAEEGAENSAGEGKRRLQKSRYDSIDCFINDGPLMQDKYNDVAVKYDEALVETLREGGVDDRLARHVAHLFSRDALVVFSDKLEMDDTKRSDHWESLQSTNWQSVRWKPPPPGSGMGWRVELRTMEVQMSAFENAAFTVITALLCRVILFFDLNLYIPISKVDENMRSAQYHDAASEGQFFFRRFVAPLEAQCAPGEELPADTDPDAYDLMTIEEILSGKGKDFPGLFPLIRAYLDIINADTATVLLANKYMRFITQRASGEIKTPAAWMRDFVRSHPDYKHDSVVSQSIAHDLLEEARKITAGERVPEELMGRYIHARAATTSVAAPHATSAGAGSGDNDDGSGLARPVRLRGASFAEEITKTECAVVRNLLDRYAVKGSFAATPAYLTIETGDDAGDDGSGFGFGGSLALDSMLSPAARATLEREAAAKKAAAVGRGGAEAKGVAAAATESA